MPGSNCTRCEPGFDANAVGTACRECLLGSLLGTCGYMPHAILASAGALLVILASVCLVTCRRGRKAAVKRGKVEGSLPAQVEEAEKNGATGAGEVTEAEWMEEKGDDLAEWNPFDEIPDSSAPNIEEAGSPRDAEAGEGALEEGVEAAPDPAPTFSPGSKFQDLRGKEWTVLSNGITSNLVFYCGEDDEVSSTAPPLAR